MASWQLPVASQETPPLVRLTKVSKSFGTSINALSPIDLEVNEGEILSIVGPSGCGKSTLLRMVAKLAVPTTGTVERLTDQIAFVFQDPTLLPWRNVRANVELLCRIRRVPKDERRRRVEAAIHLVGLNGFERRLPRELSGGMRMRVSIARALSLQPRLLLLDEPFGTLDEITRERLNDELLRIWAHEHFAAIFVTHSVYEATYLSTRVAVLSARPGRLMDVVGVRLPYPRTPMMRVSPGFVEAAAEVSKLLREGS